VRAHAGAAGAGAGAYSDERVTVPAVEAEVQVTAGRWWHLHDLDGFFRHVYHHYDAKGLCVRIAVIPIHLISINYVSNIVNIVMRGRMHKVVSFGAFFSVNFGSFCHRFLFIYYFYYFVVVF